ncbi:MAG TPA: CBS domain-containing protein [Candidatus Limnocylindrales bacterium]|nr:CBS domain-containing protein [Candidatus Limnocylindrales bacterium]
MSTNTPNPPNAPMMPGDPPDPVADEVDESVAGFIQKTIAEYEETGTDKSSFNEKVLTRPLAVLPPSEPVLIESPASVLEAVHLMRDRHAGCVLIVRAGKLKGIFTDRDVVARVVAAGLDPSKIAVRRVMTADPETLRPTDSIAFALNLMSLGGYRHIPLVDKSGTPVGTVSVKDIVGYLVGFFPKSVINLPPAPRANYARQREGA